MSVSTTIGDLKIDYVEEAIKTRIELNLLRNIFKCMFGVDDKTYEQGLNEETMKFKEKYPLAFGITVRVEEKPKANKLVDRDIQCDEREVKENEHKKVYE